MDRQTDAPCARLTARRKLCGVSLMGNVRIAAMIFTRGRGWPGAGQQTGPWLAATAVSIDRTTVKSIAAGLRYRMQPLPTSRPASWPRWALRTSVRITYKEMYLCWLAQAICDAVPTVGGHPVSHGLIKARQQRAARIAQFVQGCAPVLRRQRQIGTDIVSIALHERILRNLPRYADGRGRHRKPSSNRPQPGRTHTPRTGRGARRDGARRWWGGCDDKAPAWW